MGDRAVFGRDADGLDSDPVLEAEGADGVEVLVGAVDRRGSDQQLLTLVEVLVVGELVVWVGGVGRSVVGVAAACGVGREGWSVAGLEEPLGPCRINRWVAVVGDADAWAVDPTITQNLPGCPVGFLRLEEMWSTMLAELGTTPASSEIGRLAQLLKAAELTEPRP